MDRFDVVRLRVSVAAFDRAVVVAEDRMVSLLGSSDDIDDDIDDCLVLSLGIDFVHFGIFWGSPWGSGRIQADAVASTTVGGLITRVPPPDLKVIKNNS